MGILKKGSIFLCLLLALAACGKSEAQTDDAEAQKDDAEEAGDIWNDIVEKGEMVVGTSGTLYPASYYPEDSDELTGYDVEVMREVGERLGLDVTFEELGFDSMFATLQSGRIDVVPAGLRKEMKDQFTYSEPYKYSYSTMIVREDAVDEYQSLEDLDGKIAGGAATTVYSEIAEKFGAEVKTYGNVTNDIYLKDVQNGRTDTVINDYYLQLLALDALPDLDVTIHPDLKFHPTDQRAIVDKEAHTLRNKIDEALDEMKEDGTLTDISAEFFGGEDVSVEPDESIEEVEGIE